MRKFTVRFGMENGQRLAFSDVSDVHLTPSSPGLSGYLSVTNMEDGLQVHRSIDADKVNEVHILSQ